MGKILQGRYDRLLRRTTAQVGFGSKVGEALEDLFPVLDVESAPMEILRAAGWKYGSARQAVTPAVGTKFVCQMFNPVGSGHLIVVEKAIIHATATVDVIWGPTFVALAGTVGIGAERDTRAGAISPTIGRLIELDDGATSLFNSIRLLANAAVQIEGNPDLAVLAPGTGLTFGFAAVTISGSVSVMWRERVAEPEELNF